MQRFVPVSPTKSVMRYEVYRHKDATDEAFNLISNMYKRIMSEDKYLCMHAQKNLNAGVFINGPLHPEMEMGPLHFQKTVREVVTEHRKKEEAVGHEIWPARELVQNVAQDDIAIRTGMDSYTGEKGDLKDSLNSGVAMAITA